MKDFLKLIKRFFKIKEIIFNYNNSLYYIPNVQSYCYVTKAINKYSNNKINFNYQNYTPQEE